MREVSSNFTLAVLGVAFYSRRTPMASKGTPKKTYKKLSGSNENSRCRLCYSVVDPKHSRNLFGSSGQTYLRGAELIYGGELPQDNGFPPLIYRPCERRINNAIQFRNIIIQTQNSCESAVRTKRCVNVSPSIVDPSTKVHAAGPNRRRSLDFSMATELPQTETETFKASSPVKALEETLNANVADFLKKANEELVQVARRTEPSILRQRSYDGMSDEQWMSEVQKELSSRCPMVNDILSTLLEAGIFPDKKRPALSLIYSVIMFLRNHELSRIQRINTVLLTQGQATVNLIDQLNRYGLCLHSRTKYTILDDIGKSFLDRAAELVKDGHKFVFVLDNIDWEEKAHDMRKDIQNKSAHAVATSIPFSRVVDKSLPDAGPQKDLSKCNVRQIVDVTDDELNSVRKLYQTLVGKLLLEHFPFFNKFESNLGLGR